MAAIELPDSYPLTWPQGWVRTPEELRTGSRYGVRFAVARDHLLRELSLLGARAKVLSTNQTVKRDGMPYAGSREPDDPGAAVYWIGRDGKPQVIACDKWQTLRDNVRALGLAVAALRQLERCGASEILERSFIGFRALRAENTTHWWVTLGFASPYVTLEQVEAAYRVLARATHPDVGGSHERMVMLNAAIEQARGRLK